jgi:hypothetical protein
LRIYPGKAQTPSRGSFCEHTFVPEFRFTVFEHDPDRPWIVLGPTQHLTVELEHADEFSVWAGERWPRPRFTAELDPGQESQRLKY